MKPHTRGQLAGRCGDRRMQLCLSPCSCPAFCSRFCGGTRHLGRRSGLGHPRQWEVIQHLRNSNSPALAAAAAQQGRYAVRTAAASALKRLAARSR